MSEVNGSIDVILLVTYHTVTCNIYSFTTVKTMTVTDASVYIGILRSGLSADLSRYSEACNFFAAFYTDRRQEGLCFALTAASEYSRFT